MFSGHSNSNAHSASHSDANGDIHTHGYSNAHSLRHTNNNGDFNTHCASKSVANTIRAIGDAVAESDSQTYARSPAST